MPAAQAHIVIVSDRAAAGTRPDETAAPLKALLLTLGYECPEPSTTIVPDEIPSIVEAIEAARARPSVRFILTSGGTGAAPRDVTPEATRRVIQRELPGFGELMRAESAKTTPYAAGSRAIAGVVDHCLVLNLPGSPKGALECLGFVAKPAAHVLILIAGSVAECQPRKRSRLD